MKSEFEYVPYVFRFLNGFPVFRFLNGFPAVMVSAVLTGFVSALLFSAKRSCALKFSSKWPFGKRY